MAESAIQADERVRLSELWSYDIVDTEPDPRFDELVRLASTLCRTPIAAISLVEAERLWFKAKVGLDADELNREGSFCDAVVRSRAPVIVGDAAAHPLFRNSSLVCGAAGVRAYVGYPLESPAGAVLGSLCALDTRARAWTETECLTMRVLAAQVVDRLELRRANAELMRLWEERRTIESNSLAGRRDDQRRIAAELHDGLGQDLTGLSLLIKSLRTQAGDGAMRLELQRVEKLMRGSIQTCRRLSREQTGFDFIHGSLRESLERYIAGVNEVSGLRCELRWSETVALRDRAVAYNLYRIAQEAVTNAVRHSGGQCILVSVTAQDNGLRVEVQDDGGGLPANAGGADAGIGLETMRYRANAAGGSLELLPAMPRGLCVRCEVPLRGN